ncbi:M48 family metalloprotease [Streptomyces sp. HNM0663]|uniref:M48 family metalloprotease n=1 Tax=Streptomyces chengmaiensis TaxID=3040919 RepID=A0ABT6HZ49_9ACTN|nr:M48 family metalloprotease [Streptomyces chengmaiensis]MDH2393631.1 M48 family metalloprotease [Streptomyces chengmaiensis]
MRRKALRSVLDIPAAYKVGPAVILAVAYTLSVFAGFSQAPSWLDDGVRCQAMTPSVPALAAERSPDAACDEGQQWRLGLLATVGFAIWFIAVDAYDRITLGHRKPVKNIGPLSQRRPAVVEEIRRIADRTGMRAPDEIIHGGGGEPTATLRGRQGSPFLSVGENLLTLFRAENRLFDALVVHELTHVKNSDPRWLHLTRGLLMSAVFALPVFIVPVLALEAAEAVTAGHALGYGIALPLWQATVAIVVATLAYWSFVRDRERCADADTARVLGGIRDLADALRWLQKKDELKQQRATDRTRSFFKGLFNTHHAISRRLKDLESPAAALRLTPLHGFLLGFAAGLVVPMAQLHIAYLAAASPVSDHAVELTAAAVGSATGYILFQGIQANTLAAHRTDGERAVLASWGATLAIALALAGGLLIGNALSSTPYGFQRTETAAPWLMALGGLLATATLLCLWCRCAAGLMFRGGPRPLESGPWRRAIDVTTGFAAGVRCEVGGITGALAFWLLYTLHDAATLKDFADYVLASPMLYVGLACTLLPLRHMWNMGRDAESAVEQRPAKERAWGPINHNAAETRPLVLPQQGGNVKDGGPGRHCAPKMSVSGIDPSPAGSPMPSPPGRARDVIGPVLHTLLSLALCVTMVALEGFTTRVGYVLLAATVIGLISFPPAKDRMVSHRWVLGAYSVVFLPLLLMPPKLGIQIHTWVILLVVSLAIYLGLRFHPGGFWRLCAHTAALSVAVALWQSHYTAVLMSFISVIVVVSVSLPLGRSPEDEVYPWSFGWSVLAAMVIGEILGW